MPWGIVNNHIVTAILGTGGKDMLKITRVSQTKDDYCLRSEREKSRIHLKSEGQKASFKMCHSTPLRNTIVHVVGKETSVHTGDIHGLKYSHVVFPEPKKA